MAPDPNATLAIIAGGQSSRLAGAAKGLLVLEGRTFLSRLLDLRPLFADAFLVSYTPEAYRDYPLRCVSDLVLNRGAPGGVHAALVYARTPWVLAVACDMPFVSQAVVQALLEARNDASDLICFQIAGRLEPLLGLYRCSIASAWERALASEPSFREIFQHFRLHLLGASHLEAVDPTMRAIASVNTPEHLVRYEVKSASGAP